MDYFTNSQQPQSVNTPIANKAMARNNAGSFAFVVDDFTRLKRFLVIGTESSTYYQNKADLTFENVQCLNKCINSDGRRTVDLIVEVSDKGLALKNDAAIFALVSCLCNGDLETKRYASTVFNKVVRTGYHLFTACSYLDRMKGWSSLRRKTVANWYLGRAPLSLAKQVTKYKGRKVAGSTTQWTHRDVLRLTHAKADTSERNAILAYAVGKAEHTKEGLKTESVLMPYKTWDSIDYLGVVEVLPHVNSTRAIELILKYELPWEVLPTELTNDVDVCTALLEHMPPTATIRNLAKMTANGTLKGGNAITKKVVDRLMDQSILVSNRVHPFSLLCAMKTYQQGHGLKGKLTWTPIKSILNALDEAFYLAFGAVEATKKNIRLCLDVSGSMGWGEIAGIGMTPMQASAALALVTANVEPSYSIVGFSTDVIPLDIKPSWRLDEVTRYIGKVRMGCTDVGKAISSANPQDKIEAFVMYTDNEVNTGRHPTQVLNKYRQASGVSSKLISVGMTATQSSIADPADSLQLDVVGMSSDVPNLISTFIMS